MKSVKTNLGKVSVTVEKDYHNSTKEYDKLVIVEEKGTFRTYISRKPVPINTELTDREYWVPFSGVVENVVLDYAKFQKDVMSGLKLENNAIKERHLDTHCVTPNKIADSAVDTYAIKDKSVTEDKLSEALITMIKAATGVDTDLADSIDKLMKKVFPAEISCRFSPTALQEKGTTCIVTIENFLATVDGKIAEITRKTVNGTLVIGDTYTETINNSKAFSIVIDAEGRSTTINKSVTFVYPIYTGFSLATEATYEIISSLTKQELRTSLGTLTVTHANDDINKYFWIYSPYTVNKVTTSGINIFNDFIKEDNTMNGTIYHCYRLNKPSSTDTFTFEIS